MSEQLEHAGHKDTIHSFVGAIQVLVAVEAERDQALAQVARVRAALDENAGSGTWVLMGAVRAALEEPS